MESTTQQTGETPATRGTLLPCLLAGMLSGILLHLSFPPGDVGPLAFFALVPFFVAIPHMYGHSRCWRSRVMSFTRSLVLNA